MLISWTHDNGNIGLILRERHGTSSENMIFLTHRSLDFPGNQWRCILKQQIVELLNQEHAYNTRKPNMWDWSNTGMHAVIGNLSNRNWNVTNKTEISLYITYIKIWKCGFNQTELELQLNIHGCVWKRGIQYNMVLSFCKKMIFNHVMCFVSWPTHVVLKQLSKCVVALVSSWRLASDS